MYTKLHFYFTVRPQMTETTALGAAVAAGSAEGIGVWDLSNIQPVPSDTFYPSISLDGKNYCKYTVKVC